MRQTTNGTPPSPVSEVRLISTGSSLDTADSVEILLLQWSTPAPLDTQSHSWRSAEASEISGKRAVLQTVAPTLSAHRTRPMFVVTPELSLPLDLIADVETIVTAAVKPLVFIAGLEHMTAEQYS